MKQTKYFQAAIMKNGINEMSVFKLIVRNVNGKTIKWLWNPCRFRDGWNILDADILKPISKEEYESVWGEKL